jgi:hypothetical protein
VTNWKRGLSGLFLCLFGRGTLPASRHAVAKNRIGLFRRISSSNRLPQPVSRKRAIMLAERALGAPADVDANIVGVNEAASRALRLNERRQSELRNVFSPGRAGRGIPLSQAQL